MKDIIKGEVILGDTQRIKIHHMSTEFELNKSLSNEFSEWQKSWEKNKQISLNSELSRKLAKVLDDNNLLTSKTRRILGLSPKNTMTGEDFYKLHQIYCRHWLEPVNHHLFWKRVTQGEATECEIYGFAFEKYHYIEGAHEHMAIAAANASTTMMPHLARHFLEEYTHGDIYRAGLRRHFNNEDILNSEPLPSTRSLLNFLNELAAKDSFSYYSANELLQITENIEDGGADEDSSAVENWYKAMLVNYPFSESLIKSFRDHTKLDQKLGHQDVFYSMCRDMGELSMTQVNEALQAACDAAEQLVVFLDGIMSYYEKATMPLRKARHYASY